VHRLADALAGRRVADLARGAVGVGHTGGGWGWSWRSWRSRWCARRPWNRRRRCRCNPRPWRALPGKQGRGACP
jgi:hypothetical protein